MKVLRKVFGKIEKGNWRRRNKEVMEIYGYPNTTQKVNDQRASWLRHVIIKTLKRHWGRR